MNYLSHFIFNHRICGLPLESYFALGVVLPDLWLRFSRERRIRWRAVRGAQPADPIDQQLRDGLLNHVDVDRRFHMLPIFLRWQNELKAGTDAGGAHPAVVDFLAHMSLELALDHALLRDDPGLADRFYDVVAECDPALVAGRMAILAVVNTAGLDEVIRQFFARRFLRHYRTPAGLADVVRIVLSLAEIPPPPDALIVNLLAAAVARADPAAIWEQLAIDETRGRSERLTRPNSACH